VRERERKGRCGIAEGQGVCAHDSGGDGGEVVHVEGLGRGAAGAVGGRVVAVGAADGLGEHGQEGGDATGERARGLSREQVYEDNRII